MKKHLFLLVLLAFLGFNQLIAQPYPFENYTQTGDYSWSTEYESYYYGGQSKMWFRLLRPKNYDPSGNTKYPLMLFFHGAGENDTDNYRQLRHGGQLHRNAVRNDPVQFDGFLLYPQIPESQSWNPGTVARAKLIVDALINNFNVDPARIFSTGLSSGSAGIWDFIEDFPLIGGGGVINCNYLADQSTTSLNTIKYTPIWISQGGNDKTSTALPKVTNGVVSLLRDDYGANVRYVYWPAAGHGVWNDTWLKPEYLPFLRNVSKLNIMVLYGNQTYTDDDLVYGNGQIYQRYCAGDAINATLGITPGYAAYEWMIDGVPQGSTQSNELVVTQPGEYSVRFQWPLMGYPEYDNQWTEWSQPIIVDFNREKSDPITISSNEKSVNLPALDGSTSVDLVAPENYFSYQWQSDNVDIGTFTQNYYSAIEQGDYKTSVRTPAEPATFIDYESDYTGDQVPEPNEVPAEYRPLPVGCYSDYSNIITVTTENGPFAPTTPNNFFAYTRSANSIEIIWDDKSDMELNFELYRSVGNSNNWELHKMLPPTDQSSNPQNFLDEDLLTDTEYFYTMRAVNADGGSDYTPVRSATTTIDDESPTPPTLYTGATSRESINLYWTGATDNVGIVKYDILIDGSFYVSTTETSYTVLGLQAETVYSFNVIAYDAAGNTSIPSNLASAATILDGLYYQYFTHSGLSSVDQIESNGTLVEEGQIDNFILGDKDGGNYFALIFTGFIKIPATGDYRFYTTSDDGSKLFIDGQQIVNNDGAHGTRRRSGLISLTEGVHAIEVRYFENGGGDVLEVRWVGPGIGYQLIPDNAMSDDFSHPSPPAAPTNVNATADSYEQITITWHDNSLDETGFEIYRYSLATQSFELIGTTAAGTTSFNDQGLVAATTYFYDVKSINENGSSSNSGGISYNYYEGSFGNLNEPLFGGISPVKSGIINNFSLAPRDQEEYFGFEFAGSILIPEDGNYSFYTESDDGSNLFIDGNQIVFNDYNQGMTERGGNINIVAGIHTIKVTYRQGGGGYGLNVRYDGPNLSKQIIPDYVLNSNITYATTLTGPQIPSAPTNLSASANSTSSISLLWNHNDDQESHFEIERTSASNGTGWTLIDIIPTTGGTTETYTDNNLSGNSTLYYRVRAVGVVDNSAYSNTANATTDNTSPVFIDLIGRSVKYEEVLDLLVVASDEDGDPLTLLASGLPAFASFTDNGNNTGNLLVSPGSEGTVTGGPYEIFLTADDGVDQVTNSIIITISNNDNPVIDPISDVSLKEGYGTSFSISASDAQVEEIPTFTVDNLPSFIQFTDNGDGTGLFTIESDIGDFGSYNIKVYAYDGVGGVGLESFKVLVTKAILDQRVYINFSRSDAPYSTSPWLNYLTNPSSGAGSYNNLLDSLNNDSGIDLSWNYGNDVVYNLATQGVYPNDVMRSSWVRTDGNDIIFTISDLNPKLKYNFEVFGWNAYASITRYIAGGEEVTIDNLNNTTEVGYLKSLTPINGEIELRLERISGRVTISSLIIESYYDDGLPPNAPMITSATALNSSQIQLEWNDNSITENSFHILRSPTLNGTYAYVGEVAKNVTTYIDGGLTGSTEYFYKVSAVNDNGSTPSASASAQTLNSAPVIDPIGDLVAFANIQKTFIVSATDQEENPITFNILNLPDFVVFTDNGDGTATLVVEANSRDLGVFSDIDVIARDNFQNSTFETIDLTIVSEEYNESIYLNFTSSAATSSPWNTVNNNTNGTTYTNLNNVSGELSAIQLTVGSGWDNTSNSGFSTGLNLGEYNDEIISSYWHSNADGSFTLENLQSDLVYNIMLFSSSTSVFDTMTCEIQSVVKKIGIGENIKKIISFNGVSPDINDEITINLNNYLYTVPYTAQSTGAYINAIVINSYDPSKLITPEDLYANAIDNNSIRLEWHDRSSTENGFQIFRAQLPDGSPSLITTTGPNIESYEDMGLIENTSYQYQVRAINGTNTSNYSNTSVGTTVDFSVLINFNREGGDVVPWNDTDSDPASELSFLNFNDDSSQPTIIDLTIDYMNGFSNVTGATTGDDSGVFPDEIMRTYYFTEGGDQGSMRLQELDENYKYNIIFFGSENGTAGGPSANNEIRAVQYIIGNEVVTLNNAHNTQNTVQINNLSPDQNNEINFIIRPVGGARWGFLNCMVVQAYDATNEQTNSFDFEYFAMNGMDISQPQSWNSDINGTGFTPTDFSGDGLTYIIPDNSSVILNENFSLSGEGSLLEAKGNNQLSFNNTASSIVFEKLNLYTNEYFELNGANKSTLYIGDGGISLNDNSTLILGSNDLIISGDGGFNSNNESGQISVNNGNIEINSTGVNGSNLSFVSGSDSLHNLTVNIAAASTVNLNSPVHVRNIIDLQSGDLFTNDNLILVSENEYTGKIAKVGAGASLVGEITSQRQIVRDRGGSYLIGTPIKGQTINNWLDDFIIQGIDESLPASWGNVFEYEEQIYGFTEITSGLTNVDPGQGIYAYLYSSNFTDDGQIIVENSGLPVIGNGLDNTGSEGELFDFAVTYDNPDPDVDLKGWNLISNPYPCEIDWNLLNWDSPPVGELENMSSAIYVWDGYNRTYVEWNHTLGTSMKIASGQGFYVKAIGSSPVLRISEDIKVTSGASFLRKEGPQEVLSINFFDQEGHFDQAHLVSREDATMDFDKTYDVINKEGSYVNISSQSPDGKDLAINVMPLMDESVTIPLSIKTLNQGTHKIVLEGLETFNNRPNLFLIDNFMASLVLVDEGYEYDFEITSDPASFGKDRILLASYPSAYLGVDKVSSKKGKQISVPLFAKNFVDVMAFNGEITWDPEKIRLIKLDEIGLDNTNNQVFDLNNASQGFLKINWIGNEGQFLNFDSLVLGKMIFEAIDKKLEVADIKWTNFDDLEVKHKSGDPLNVIFEDGSVVISSMRKIRFITRNRLRKSLAGVELRLWNTLNSYTSISDKNGIASFEIESGLDYQYSISKEINEDTGDLFTLKNVYELKQSLLGNHKLDKYSELAADIDQSGKLSALDLRLFKDYLLGKKINRNHIGEWMFMSESDSDPMNNSLNLQPKINSETDDVDIEVLGYQLGKLEEDGFNNRIGGSPIKLVKNVEILNDTQSIISFNTSEPLQLYGFKFVLEVPKEFNPNQIVEMEGLEFNFDNSENRISVLWICEDGKARNSHDIPLLQVKLSNSNLDIDDFKLSSDIKEATALDSNLHLFSIIDGQEIFGNNSIQLMQNVPNPFDGGTTIRIVSISNLNSQFTIHNSLGQLVFQTELMLHEGNNFVEWDGRDLFGVELRPGLYVYTLSTADKIYSKKMLKKR